MSTDVFRVFAEAYIELSNADVYRTGHFKRSLERFDAARDAMLEALGATIPEQNASATQAEVQ